MLSPGAERVAQPPLTDKMDPFDWDGILSLETIRMHTKTGDVPGVTDEQLILYRRAAVETAEHYTGMLLTGKKTMTEPVRVAHRPGQSHYKHKLKYPSADGIVYLYGGAQHGTVKLVVMPNSRTIRIPVIVGYIDLSNCCNPCSPMMNDGLVAMYQAGYPCVTDVPAGIVLGIMQFLAWVVEHPGDELLTQRNRLDARGGAGVYGSNNIAMVSGAVETWRIYDPEAF